MAPWEVYSAYTDNAYGVFNLGCANGMYGYLQTPNNYNGGDHFGEEFYKRIMRNN